MLDALLNFAMMNVAFIIIATIVGVYALVRVTARVKGTSAQLDAHSDAQLAAIDRERAATYQDMDIHSRV
jgi:hypothetical protein